ncbi:protein phosphatase 1 regulatory subunit 36 isoform 2-T5 [Amazona ochrocephala]
MILTHFNLQDWSSLTDDALWHHLNRENQKYTFTSYCFQAKPTTGEWLKVCGKSCHVSESCTMHWNSSAGCEGQMPPWVSICRGLQTDVLLPVLRSTLCNAPVQQLRKTLKKEKILSFRKYVIFQDDCSSKLPERKLVDKEGKLHMISQWVQHEYVTLDDVKYAALLLKDTHESHHMLSLEVVMGNKKLDDFLMALLFYISFYLEKIALEKRYRSLTLTMISFEKTEMDNVLEKLAMSRIHLARLYCNLMLGRHMAQQSSRKEKPSLQRDRSYSEGLYNFSSYVTWLVFRRKHFQVIREEIGRLLFSDVFNPALRGKKNTVLQKQGGGAGDANTVQLLYPRTRTVRLGTFNLARVMTCQTSLNCSLTSKGLLLCINRYGSAMGKDVKQLALPHQQRGHWSEDLVYTGVTEEQECKS